jgi:hypothetical protein
MTQAREFRPLKSGAILLGYPGTTQDVDIFPRRSPENGKRIVSALQKLGFQIGSSLENEIVAGKDFVQIKTGPFDVDLVFAPDGISSFDKANARALVDGGFRIANLRDIIASKRATGRQKDRIELPLLESFRAEFEKRGASPLRSASDVAGARFAKE